MNSRALSPCGPAPLSVPQPIFTPALVRFARRLLDQRAHTGCLDPDDFLEIALDLGLSATKRPAQIVGTYQVPFSFISDMISSST